MPSGLRREKSGPPWLVLGLVVFIVVLGFGIYPNAVADVQRPPRPNPPTVEQVKIFEVAAYAENLESEVNAWLKAAGGQFRIIDRKFVVTARGALAIAIFYERIPERPTPQQKLPAEKP